MFEYEPANQHIFIQFSINKLYLVLVPNKIKLEITQ